MRRFLLVLVLVMLVAGCERATAQGEVKGGVYIPRIGLVRAVVTAPVVEADRNYDLTALGDGVAWLEGTAWLEHDWARIVLAGHTPGAFEDIRLLEPGDTVLLWDAHRAEVYAVTGSLVVRADDVRWLMPTAGETLVLLTCEGEGRLVVLAERVY